MEPVTHFLTGACIRSRRCSIGKPHTLRWQPCSPAEAADLLDILWNLAGPVEGLQHHRGIFVTASSLAVPVVAAIITGAVWLYHLWRKRRQTGSATQPVRWAWVYISAFIASLSHILLDWTNNYGVRPFFPFNPRWYAGSFVFIAEPVLWALLLAALIMPWLFGLTDSEIGARRKPFRGQGWAIFALLQHGHPLVLALSRARTRPSPCSRARRSPPASIRRLAVEP